MKAEPLKNKITYGCGGNYCELNFTKEQIASAVEHFLKEIMLEIDADAYDAVSYQIKESFEDVTKRERNE